MSQPELDIGIDVGGTFTDFTFFNHTTREHWVRKVPSTPTNVAEAVVQGLLETDLENVRNIVHGSTVALNSIIQREGAKTALLTTRGFRDHIEIGDTLRYTGGLYDHRWTRTRPYPIPRENRFEVTERTESDGTVSSPVSESELATIATELRGGGFEAVSICFLNSYVDPANEVRASDFLTRELPGVTITVSSVNPEFREYPRFITSVFNAFVGPSLAAYVNDLEGTLAARGYNSPVLYMTSAGGIVTKETVLREPLLLLFGAVAGGVSASAHLAKLKGIPGAVTFDMGGTSTDVGFIQNYTPEVTPSKVIVAFPIALPHLDVRSIGAGGGSIASCTDSGTLRVGPESAGANPGPACYGRGGTDFTVTDANLLLGRIGESSLLNGEVRLDRGLAEAAAKELLHQVGISDIYELADGVIQLCVTNMYGALREVSIERGKDPADLTLVAFGGAGGLHAAAIAKRLQMPRVLVPRNAGIFSALGMLVSDRRLDAVQPYIRPINGADFDEIRNVFDRLGRTCVRRLIDEGIDEDAAKIIYQIGLRYSGQIYEETIEYDEIDMNAENLGQRFGRLYEQSYGFSREVEQIEIVNLRVTGIGLTDKPDLRINEKLIQESSAASAMQRPVFITDGFKDCQVLRREELSPAYSHSGPIVIEEYDSTTYVPPGWRASVDEFNCLVLEEK